MPLILNIETATNICSVALSEKEKIISFRETSIENSHSSLLTVFIEKIFNEAKIKLSDIDAVCVSKGPGSFTGLRIGVSTAKGLCYALEKPLLSVNTLKAITWGMIKNKKDKNTLYCPMLDARRMEVYTALFNSNLEEVETTNARIIDKNSFSEILSKTKIIFFGDGADKCREILKNNQNAVFIDDFNTSAKYMAELSYQKFTKKEFENVAYFEPYYLKDFFATTPKDKLA
ncbi:MAG: tRNA (adenosine(37)-N6)-threonylcarbamoyltransferase complex dimerization subunit type 1 TsaB [Bacteroidales bacterium]|nr:tRNA (adenosine(37)-N6)-threonylcarbamoyltransferase complex dimerization subunit type 1 TsaB [Bacteroidales bacterium]